MASMVISQRGEQTQEDGVDHQMLNFSKVVEIHIHNKITKKLTHTHQTGGMTAQVVGFFTMFSMNNLPNPSRLSNNDI